MRRRAPDDVLSPIRLDHGDVLFMDGLAQSEYVHRTVSVLQGPLVNVTYRSIAQHTASCPLAGVVGCVLPTCAQGLVEPSPLEGRRCSETCLVCSVEEALSELSGLMPPGGASRSMGSRTLGWRKALATVATLSRRCRHQKGVLFGLPW